ncbi:MAG: hypothetical protein HY854_07910 [Burkholderiales bacterium]|nr:hypothetical protein [Burkholderiales bacterium]
MKQVTRSPYARYLGAAVAALAFAWGTPAQAHCDALDGPVVQQGRKALDSGNVNLVLGWVRKANESEVRAAFERAAAVRKQGGAARDLADQSFYETLVRVHRAGEGAPYTGLKPAGHIEPAVAAADKSIDNGQIKPVARMIFDEAEQGLHRRFAAVQSTRKHAPDDVEAARRHVDAYVDYVHYVERLHGSAGAKAATPGGEAGHGH